jgi:DNA-binding XRE family transcriptional regulator
MPYKSEKIKIEFTEKDKRIKLTDEQREKIKKDYSTGLISQRDLAKKYKVDRKTIYNILHEDKYQEQLERYKEEKHSKQYYNKEKHKDYIKTHRRYKQELYVKGEIKEESEEI